MSGYKKKLFHTVVQIIRIKQQITCTSIKEKTLNNNYMYFNKINQWNQEIVKLKY